MVYYTHNVYVLILTYTCMRNLNIIGQMLFELGSAPTICLNNGKSFNSIAQNVQLYHLILSKTLLYMWKYVKMAKRVLNIYEITTILLARKFRLYMDFDIFTGPYSLNSRATILCASRYRNNSQNSNFWSKLSLRN